MTVRESAAIGVQVPLFAAVEQINHRQREMFVDRVTIAAGGLEGARVALLGLTFKPDTDDLREAPSLEIARMLIERGATVVAYDPMPTARQRAAELVPGLAVVDRAMKAIVGADAIGLVTEWPEFARLPWGTIAKAVRRPAVVDGRNALQAEVLVAAGFDYTAFGRDGKLVVDETAAAAIAAAAAAAEEDEELGVTTGPRRRTAIEAALSGTGMDRGLPAIGAEPKPTGA
jgi:UDPglucose 6-dehydrogenase